MKDIILATINAKWIHPSLALRLLKANLGPLEERCGILEFNLRQPLAEMTRPILEAAPGILGVSVSVWNHLATIGLLKELEKYWEKKPFIVLGGPEVSHLPPGAEIFKYSNHVIRGEGETAFRNLCEDILLNDKYSFRPDTRIMLNEIKPAYHLYTDEDLRRKLIYVESSRGCPFSCEFCLSSVKEEGQAVREFDAGQFLAQMDSLILRGAKTFKFLDRTFNLNIPRAIKIIEFFLEKLNHHSLLNNVPFAVHFEMIPSNFPPQLIEALARFPPGSLRLEIGIQTLNAEVSSRIKLAGGNDRFSNPRGLLDTLSLLRRKTNAIIHADLIAGLPGETLESFGEGFDLLWQALNDTDCDTGKNSAEIQLGVLKNLPGTPVWRHAGPFKMRFNDLPPYDIEETSSMSAQDIARLKNFARFWELVIGRSLIKKEIRQENRAKTRVFNWFMELSERLFAHFGRNWGIDKSDLIAKIKNEHFPQN